ncbi:MAG: glycosyltransferase family 2 protein [Pseudomonadota bacterium]
MKVSVLILAHNEAANLPRCLSALSWCDDIVVIDSGSSDGGQEIAAQFGARVLTRAFDDFAGQRNYGVAVGDFKHDWVLHLDADEVATPAFIAALEALPDDPPLDGYHLPSKLMIGERWLKHAGGYPTYQARLGHRARFSFVQVGHGQREHPTARMGVFSEPYLHYNFSHGMRRWLEKHIRYAADEAALLGQATTNESEDAVSAFSRLGLRRRLKRLFGALPLWLRPPLRFFHVLIVNQGFRDGAAGLAYAVMMAVYEGMIAVFAYEARFTREATAPERTAPEARSGAKPATETKAAG